MSKIIFKIDDFLAKIKVNSFFKKKWMLTFRINHLVTINFYKCKYLINKNITFIIFFKINLIIFIYIIK